MEDLSSYPSAYIAGRSIHYGAGDDIQSLEPYTGERLWSCAAPTADLVESAVSGSRKAFEPWRARSLEDRIEIATNFTKLVQRDKDRLALLVAAEAGKPLWESKVEVNSLVTKLEASVDAYSKRCAETGRLVKGLQSRTRFRPHGVVAVLGPYNFPLSMANGHTMPALIAGNCVVFKPSELTSLCGIAVAELWGEAGLPPDVLNCVSGGADVGRMLVGSQEIDGVFFVGSHAAGVSILEKLAKCPEKIVAVEMGGNSPLLIEDFDEGKLNSVLSIIIHSSFISSGQRCSAARRLLINRKYSTLPKQLADAIGRLRIGHYKGEPEPFYGPMIRPIGVERALNFAQRLEDGGAVYIRRPSASGPHGTLLSPGLIDVNECSTKVDEELFGPILQFEFYDSLPDGIRAAESTKYGLAAGIVTEHVEKFVEFSSAVKAGIVNWNQQLTGATTFAPFGGVKHSGNYRPAGYLSADYCSYAVASFEIESKSMVVPETPGLNLV